MSKSREFHRDEAGSSIGKAALLSAAAAVICVLGANFLSTMLQKGEFPIIAFVQPEGRAKRIATTAPGPVNGREAGNFRGVGVDMAATATIPGRPRSAPAASLSEKDRK